MKAIRKDWESEFFKKEIGLLEISENTSLDPEVFIGSLKSVFLESKPIYDYIEINLKSQEIYFAPYLEDLGFRLCDSRYQFVTMIDKNKFQSYNILVEPDLEMRMFSAGDQAGVMDLTINYLVNDPNFISKYKSPYFFSPEIAEKYFRQWINYSIESVDSFIAVLKSKDSLEGFFIYKQENTWKGLNLYKGILAAITNKYRGKNYHLALQEFLFNNIPYEKFYVDNTTQLSNIPTVKNHFLSRRVPSSIHFTFLWKK